MGSHLSVLPDSPEETLVDPEGGGPASEDDLWCRVWFPISIEAVS